jgi:hypothetical protein
VPAADLLAAGIIYLSLYTCDGEGGKGDPAPNSTVNGNPGGVLSFAVGNNDLYLFMGSSTTVAIQVQSGGPGMRDMTFDAGMQFTKIVPGNNSTSSSSCNNGYLVNNSTSAQTFDNQVALYRGYLMPPAVTS